MIPPLATTVIAAALIVAAATALLMAVNRRGGRVVLAVLGVVEVLVLAQAVASVVLLATGQRPEGNTLEFLAYQLGTVLVLPAGTLWSLSDRSRWAVGVLTVACLAVAVMTVRMNRLWG